MRAIRHKAGTRAAGLLAAAAAILAVATGPAHADPASVPTPIADPGSAVTGLATFAANQLLSGLVPPVLMQAMALGVVPLNQLWSFNQIITHESSWNPFALNPSGAYGLGQALPADKMSSESWDWIVNPLTQLRWAYKYMNDRYGSPNAAWAFWQANHWY